MTARELLRYAAYRFDCTGQCGDDDTCKKVPPCTEVTDALLALADRFDTEELMLGLRDPWFGKRGTETTQQLDQAAIFVRLDAEVKATP